MAELEYRIKLRSSAFPKDIVIFDVTPDFAESRAINYKTVDPIHAPGQIYAFVNSSSRTFQISGARLISRTQEEAQKNLDYLWLLRSWTLPSFGSDSASAGGNREDANANKQANLKMNSQSAEYKRREYQKQGGKTSAEVYGVDLRGAPPQVLLLSAYAHDGHYGEVKNNINRVPVVITSLNIPYPSDVDYFPTTGGIPMPTVMSIDISLSETHSAREYENFSLARYKSGILGGF